MTEIAEWIVAAPADDVTEGEILGVTLGDREIALYRINGEFFATDNVCTHARAMLSDGWLEGDVVECPLHGGRFKVQTGEGLGAPIVCDLKTFPVRVRDGNIEIPGS